uniref:Uncharacterized protein n=1 Tax=Anguilla anguilla TaxID=7936 RepID=A0A0E9RYV5_ANGAN
MIKLRTRYHLSSFCLSDIPA